MYCTRCGQEIRDGEVHNCTAEPQMIQPPMNAENPSMPEDFSGGASPIDVIRGYGMSIPTMLAALFAAIPAIYTFVMNIINVSDITKAFRGTPILGDTIAFIIYPILILAFIISLLVPVGLFLIWNSSRKTAYGNISTAGFTFIQVYAITMIVIVALLAIIIIIGEIVMFARELDTGMMIWLLFCLTVIFTLWLMYYIKLNAAAASAKQIVLTGVYNRKMSLYLPIVNIIVLLVQTVFWIWTLYMLNKYGKAFIYGMNNSDSITDMLSSIGISIGFDWSTLFSFLSMASSVIGIYLFFKVRKSLMYPGAYSIRMNPGYQPEYSAGADYYPDYPEAQESPDYRPNWDNAYQPEMDYYPNPEQYEATDVSPFGTPFGEVNNPYAPPVNSTYHEPRPVEAVKPDNFMSHMVNYMEEPEPIKIKPMKVWKGKDNGYDLSPLGASDKASNAEPIAAPSSEPNPYLTSPVSLKETHPVNSASESNFADGLISMAGDLPPITLPRAAEKSTADVISTDNTAKASADTTFDAALDVTSELDTTSEIPNVFDEYDMFSDATVLLTPPEPPKPRAVLRRSKDMSEVVIDADEFKIGKNEKLADYQIPDNPTVSRVHCIITRKNRKFYISDNNALNGTYVNENRITEEIELNSGDSIKLSDEVFTFTVEA